MSCPQLQHSLSLSPIELSLNWPHNWATMLKSSIVGREGNLFVCGRVYMCIGGRHNSIIGVEGNWTPHMWWHLYSIVPGR